jgi:hypothetical protein
MEEKNQWRHLVENFFCSIKAFRRIATRYEKTDKCFAVIVNFVHTVLWKSASTALFCYDRAGFVARCSCPPADARRMAVHHVSCRIGAND